MPEGPSIAILREEASIFNGKKVISATGNTKVDIAQLEGKKITDMRSWGKHFLMCFGPHLTVRIHLMMFGSYRVNDVKESPPRLSLQFTTGELNFYTCSVQIIEGDLNDIYDWQVDVMADTWNPKHVLDLLKETKKMKVCDALLDQTIFAGSGNIIKNEVLFRIKVHPNTLIDDLPAAKLKELVAETRKYSLQFYTWKKAYVLSKHWEAYKQKTCPRCNIRFKLEHLGKGHRRTFFCDNCQVFYGIPLKETAAEKSTLKKAISKTIIPKKAASKKTVPKKSGTSNSAKIKNSKGRWYE